MRERGEDRDRERMERERDGYIDMEKDREGAR